MESCFSIDCVMVRCCVTVFVFDVRDVGPAGRELDIGALFEKYTIDEIRDFEKKTRSLLC